MNGLSFASVMVANRGEIAARILRTVKASGLRGLLVAHAIDGDTPAMAFADEVRFLDGPSPVAAFLDATQIIAAAHDMGAEAIHPGYGFLSENAEFAAAVEAAGIVWIGPRPETIALMGDKIRARAFVEARGFPVAPSAIEDDDPASFVERARALGAPILIKPSAGGGGKGMRIVRDMQLLDEEVVRARSEGLRYFGDGRLFVERYIERPRHIEVQVLGDEAGDVVHVLERECSLQRRFQKIIEEAPSPALTSEERTRICETAAGIARAARYRGAGTVEFIYGEGEFYFLEMNTRLQVEHPVTEAITGLDLVAEQLHIAAGHPLRISQEAIAATGHAIEMRICAEDPGNDFSPTSGKVLRFRPSKGHGIRCDPGVMKGSVVGPSFDPMLGKLIIHASDRPAALALARSALAEFVLLGVKTNISYMAVLLADVDVAAGALHTGLIAEKPELAEPRPLTAPLADVLVAATACVIPEILVALDAVPALHAKMGGWRN